MRIFLCKLSVGNFYIRRNQNPTFSMREYYVEIPDGNDKLRVEVYTI